jgi:hypothetical protein
MLNGSKQHNLFNSSNLNQVKLNQLDQVACNNTTCIFKKKHKIIIRSNSID